MQLSEQVQLKTSESIKFFHEGFKNRWDLKEYEDNEAPAVFFGLYTDHDVNLCLNHKGFKVLLFAGQDITNYPRLKHLNCISDQYIELHGKIIPVKSYDIFKPVPLGEKIYVYSSTNSKGFHDKFRMETVAELQKHFGYDKVLIGYHGNTIETMRDQYYSNSFINLQLNKDAGFTSALEMAHMGRKSISNYNASFCLPYNSVNEIIEHIEKEQQYIGQTRELDLSFLFNSNEWLTKEYWNGSK